MNETPPPKFHLDWNLLRTFAVIVQCQGISRAAAALNLTQPAISSALRRLEEQVGHQLIRRGGTVFDVTAEGRLLYRESQEILVRISRINEVLSDTSEEIRGVIKLAVASHVVFPFLDRLLKDFHDKYPNVRYQIEVDKSAHIAESLLMNTVTAGICLVYQEHEKLEYQHFFTEYFGLFCGKEHRYFGQDDIAVKDICKENFVSFQTDQMDDALWPVALMRNQNRMTGKIVGTSPNLEEVRRLITAGIGIGPLPIHSVEVDVERGLLWQLPPYSDTPSVDVYVCTNPSCRYSRAESLFLDFLINSIALLTEEKKKLPQNPKQITT
ncbi:LysR family transcriptional regulator [Emcibacter sp.]|uniref:LysR family transcriptional regulator n=1 Tax=Emcibacter sp. TaxID=1979954 RepID=UPI002AA6328B|nr:LysR family transcriptional regulator [Emcibacter sp.]